MQERSVVVIAVDCATAVVMGSDCFGSVGFIDDYQNGHRKTD
ncbi:hypothetical protein BN1012_Phect2140 [Candidatus Phaeomarinobacter ectocarpi]|uniref:Uncharacterized protein n=1 Tax=Candidatus Phaeomarinibacter ectocarpi TaxID=1458461 RepID=X5M9P9_9HYPH|nr:hypothetical protein BN1012_Phect2140 [Candidatus Phaeomarinobacter ectocarpi]